MITDAGEHCQNINAVARVAALQVHEDPVNESRFQVGGKDTGKEVNYDLSWSITKLKASLEPRRGHSSLNSLDSKCHLS